MSQYYVYILSNCPYGTFYIGVTNHLIKRIWQHKFSGIKGFKEKRLKKWPRQWKINLILKNNPLWKDLYEEIIR